MDIVLVEDNEADRLLTVHELRRHGTGHHIYEARNARQALSILQGDLGTAPEQGAVLLVDIHLPDMTGLDLVDQLRQTEQWSAAPTFILTGDTDMSCVRRAMALNVEGYVLKSSLQSTLNDPASPLSQHLA